MRGIENPAGKKEGGRDAQDTGQEGRSAHDPGLFPEDLVKETDQDGMENVVIGSAVIGQDVLEIPGGVIDKGIRFIVGDRLADPPQTDERSDERDGPQTPVDIGWILPWEEKLLKCGENGSGKSLLLLRIVHGAKSAPAQTRTALFGSGGRHSVH